MADTKRSALFDDDSYESTNVEDRRDEPRDTDQMNPFTAHDFNLRRGNRPEDGNYVTKGSEAWGQVQDKMMKFAGGGGVDAEESTDDSGEPEQPQGQQGPQQGPADERGPIEKGLGGSPGQAIGRGIKALLSHLTGANAQPVQLAPGGPDKVKISIGQDSHTVSAPQFLAWMADTAEAGGQAPGQAPGQFPQEPGSAMQTAQQPQWPAAQQPQPQQQQQNRYGSVGTGPAPGQGPNEPPAGAILSRDHGAGPAANPQPRPGQYQNTRKPLWEPNSEEGRSRALFPQVSQEGQRQAWIQGQREQETKHGRAMEVAQVGVQKAQQQGAQAAGNRADAVKYAADQKAVTDRERQAGWERVKMGVTAQKDAAARLQSAAALAKVGASTQNAALHEEGQLLGKQLSIVPFQQAAPKELQAKIDAFRQKVEQFHGGVTNQQNVPAQAQQGGQQAPQGQNVPAQGQPAVGTTKVFKDPNTGATVTGVWDGKTWKGK